MNVLFKALNDPTRRQILELLREGDRTAGDIADRFEMTKPSISHHLDLLKQADLVIPVRQGQFITYSLNTTVLDALLAWVLKLRQTTESSKTEHPVNPYHS
jgi:ArsR family transcriptional regulator